MQLKPEEISKIIRAQIKHYENVIEQSEVGTVILVGDGIARASGLEKCMAGELLQFENGEYGMAQNLEENTVSIVLLGSDVGIKEGSTVKRTGKVVSVPVAGLYGYDGYHSSMARHWTRNKLFYQTRHIDILFHGNSPDYEKVPRLLSAQYQK